MTFERRRRWAGALLLAAALLGGLWLARLDWSRAVSTDVLDLIPAGEREPELALIRTLASDREARTMLCRLTEVAGGPVSGEAARRFAAELARSPAVAQAVVLADPGWRDEAGRALAAERMALLFPAWAAERTAAGGDPARATARELKAFLERPEALAYQDMIPADPLLLLPRVWVQLKDRLGPAGAGTGDHGLVWVQLAVSPLREEGQAPVWAALERARAAAGPGIQLSYTGTNRFAAASRARIEREVKLLNLLSLAAVLAVAVGFLRTPWRALHLVPAIALATLGAWVATTLVFERVHAVVFVLGALLTGVAIDYGFYLFMQPPAYPGEDYTEKVRRLAKPLAASCATTVAGFALLLAAELPMLRQLGLFVGAGLVSALAAAVLYFALGRAPYLPARTGAGGGPRAEGGAGRRWLRRGAVGLAVLLAAGAARVQWRDDIRDLEVPAPELYAEDARIREAFGQRPERTVFLVHGRTLAEAREALERLERWAGGRAALAHLGAVVPTTAALAAARLWGRERPEFARELQVALEAEGFDAAAFAPFFTAYRAYLETGLGEDPESAVRRLTAALRGPVGLLVHAGKGEADGSSWLVAVADRRVEDVPPAETSAVAASQLRSLNRLFAGYRQSALRLSVAGLALVGLGVLLTYGWRDGLRIFALPAGSCLAVFGAFGWAGMPLNLFHLIGAFLGVCLTHNYAIFSAESAFRAETTPVSVRLSALTTGASFGVLATSTIPAVAALGMTVAAMVAAALVAIELEHLRPLRKGAAA